MKKLALAAAISAALSPSITLAYEAGDVIIRAGATTVAPDEKSGDVTLNGGSAASTVSVSNETQLGLTATYMYNANFGVELLAATPFSHDIAAQGALKGLGNIAKVKHLPPTLSAVYYFNSSSAFKPYAGAGLNYTHFFDESATDSINGALGGSSSVKLDDSFGLALQLGADYEINERLYANASVRWIDISTDATITGGGNTVKVKVDIDPWVYSLMLGYKF